VNACNAINGEEVKKGAKIKDVMEAGKEEATSLS